MTRYFAFLLLTIISNGLIAQDIQGSVATRLIRFDNNEIVDTSAEQLSPLSYGSVGVYSGSMKFSVQFEGVFYHAFYGNNGVFIRKSNDGIVWSDGVSVNDSSTTGYVDIYPNITVWRSGTEIHVGVAYIDSGQPLEQLRFVKSTDGGNTFGEPIFISNHSDSQQIMNCGFSSKGDTLLATWTRYNGWGWDSMWESHSLDGGITWSPQQVAYTGWQYTFVGDSDIDEDGNFYAVICADLGWRVELAMVRSTDLGQTWVQTTQATDLGSPHTSTNAQIIVEDSVIYISSTHSNSYLDAVNLHRSEDFGQTWSAITVSDSDSLHVSSNIGGGTFFFCHTTIAKGGANRLYMAWADSRDHNAPDYAVCDYYVYLAWSDDGGTTWSPNYRVSSPSNYDITTSVYVSLSVLPGETGDQVLVTWTKNRDVANIQVFGCTDNTACNYSLEANTDDGSCLHVGDACDDGIASTTNDIITELCECEGTSVGVEEWQRYFMLYPNPSSELVRLQSINGDLIERVIVRDIQGRDVLNRVVQSSAMVIDVTPFPFGRFVVLTQTANGLYSLPLSVMSGY